jgi:hypothetical protein
MANTAPREAEAASSFRARIVILCCWPQQSYWYSKRTRRKSLGANFETQWSSVFCQPKSLAALLIIASGTEANFIAVVAVICNPHFGGIVVIWIQIQAASSASVKTSQGDHPQNPDLARAPVPKCGSIPSRNNLACRISSARLGRCRHRQSADSVAVRNFRKKLFPEEAILWSTSTFNHSIH